MNCYSHINYLTGLLLLSTIFVLNGCSSEVSESPERIRPVKYIEVKAGTDALRDRVFSGTTQAAQESRISFNVSGTVKQLPIAIGDRVKQGQLIASLDSATYSVEVQRAKASVLQADAERRNAEAEYQRVRQLYANDNASRNELDATLSRTESANANHKAMLQSLALARLNLGYTRLTASSDCSIATVDVELNENVAAGAQVATINCGNNWEVEIAVPESLIATFKNGLEGSVQFGAINDKIFTAKVSEVGIAGGGTTTFPVTLVLDEGHPTLRSGLAAEVTFAFAEESTNEEKTIFYVPPAAVGNDEQGTFVYVLEIGDTANTFITRRRAVSVGSLNEYGLEIKQGLTDGDRVVTAGVTAARDGLQVKAE